MYPPDDAPKIDWLTGQPIQQPQWPPQDPTLATPTGSSPPMVDNSAPDEPPPEEPPPHPEPTGFSEAQPNRAQKSLAESAGIKTFGPSAMAAKQAGDQYRAGIASSEDATGQGAPQQFGVEEPIGQNEGPLSPAQTAEKFLENAKPEDLHKGKVETPDEMRARNAHYNDYVAESRSNRDEERNRLREQGSKNREERRQQDADVWRQMTALNGLQGHGGGGPGGGGPFVENIGGFNFVGPTNPYGGRHGANPFEPEKLALRERELAARVDNNEKRNANYQEKNQVGAEGNEIRREGIKASNERSAANIAVKKDSLKEVQRANQAREAYHATQSDQNKATSLASSINAVEALAADLTSRDALAKKAWTQGGAQQSRDAVFNDKGRSVGSKAGEYQKRVDMLMNEMQHIHGLAPDGSYADRMSPATRDYIDQLIESAKGNQQGAP